MTTATRIHAGDRPHDLTAIATTLPKRKGQPNLRGEAAAWRQLAGALAADPAAALSCALDLARSLCHAESAGLSLFKPDGANGTSVRWKLVRGALAPHEGLDAPLSRTPCGLCLDAGATILVSRPAQAFAWFEDMRPPIRETLIAPLRDSSGRIEGTLWIAHHGDRSRCSADDARIVEQLADQVVLALRLQEQAQRADAAEREARRELTFKAAMIDEVNHRTKNTLLAAAGLLSLQARGASAEVNRALMDSRDRLQLLADVHATISTGLDDRQTVLMPQLLQMLCNALRRSFGSTNSGVSSSSRPIPYRCRSKMQSQSRCSRMRQSPTHTSMRFRTSPREQLRCACTARPSAHWSCESPIPVLAQTSLTPRAAWA